MLHTAQFAPLRLRHRFNSSHLLRFFSGRVQLQLDYYLSSRYAGIAVAQKQDLYKKAGLTLEILPEVEPGQEPRSTSEMQAKTPDALCIGIAAQNVLFDCAAAQCTDVTAVSTMFGKSPLCLIALPTFELSATELAATEGKGLVIGAETDNVGLIQRILPQAKVLAVPRATKLHKMQSGEINLVQGYNVMEPVALGKKLGQSPVVFPIAACTKHPIQLGYSQVIFVASSILQNSDLRAGLRTFLEVTYSGWEKAIRNLDMTAKVVMESQPSGIDHWVDDEEFTVRVLERCCGYVLVTQQGSSSHLGMIDPAVWHAANTWYAADPTQSISADKFPKADTSVWSFPPTKS